MAIDRTALRKQLDEAKTNRGSGKIAFLKTKDGKAQRLRVVEFVDSDGNSQFARLMATWQQGQDNKSQILNRQLTFGATDAPTRFRELCDEGGTEFPYTRLRKQYLLNAVDVDVNPPQMRVYAVPMTVWESMVELLLTDQWADLTDPATGHPLIISRTGTGLDTEYSTQPDRKPWPVPTKLLQAVIDPVTAVTDPGVAKQCELMNVTIEELYGDSVGEIDDIAPIVFEQAEVAVPARAAAPAPIKKPAIPVRVPVAAPVKAPVKKAPVAPVEEETEPLFEDEVEEAAPVVDRSRLPGAKKPAVTAAKPAAKVGGKVDTASLVRSILKK